MDAGIGVGQAAQIGAQQVAAFMLRQKAGKVRMRLREHRLHAIQEPVDLLRAAQENAAQHAADDAVGMGLGIGERQRRAPGPAEQQKALDRQMAAQDLDIRDEVRRGVVLQAAQRTRPSRAPLVENDDAPVVRIEETTMHRAGAGAGAAVQEQHRPSIGVAGLLPIHDMTAGERQIAGLVGADLGE